MTDIKEVVFTPHNNHWSMVTATLVDDSKKVVYLDNMSAKTFLQQALMVGSSQPPKF